MKYKILWSAAYIHIQFRIQALILCYGNNSVPITETKMKTIDVWTLSASILAGGALVLLAPVNAMAQARPAYDGYCYQKKNDAAVDGAVAGGAAGAVIGSTVAGRGERVAGAAIGAAIGATVGSEAGRSGAQCYEGAYYVYYEGYVPPPPPPPGYAVVFYNSRPAGVVYRPVVIAPRGAGYRAGYRHGYYDGRHPYRAY